MRSFRILTLAGVAMACLAAPAFAQDAAVPAPAPAAAPEGPAPEASAPAPQTAAPEAGQIADMPVEQARDSAIPDPFEGLNRGMYKFNDALDRAIFEPVAKGYRAIAPSPVRAGVRNFLQNLSSPVVFVNDALQGDAPRAGVTAGRFAINTTVGVLGIFDPATHIGLERHNADFGQTLGVWGVGSGAYIFLPLFGPTSVRDGVGRIVDIAFDPLSWAKFDGDDEFRATRFLLGAVSTREQLIEPIDELRTTSIDPYVTMRSLYATTRAGMIRKGDNNVQDLPSFDEVPSPAPAEAAAPVEPVAPSSVEGGQQGKPP